MSVSTTISTPPPAPYTGTLGGVFEPASSKHIRYGKVRSLWFCVSVSGKGRPHCFTASLWSAFRHWLPFYRTVECTPHARQASIENAKTKLWAPVAVSPLSAPERHRLETNLNKLPVSGLTLLWLRTAGHCSSHSTDQSHRVKRSPPAYIDEKAIKVISLA